MMQREISELSCQWCNEAQGISKKRRQSLFRPHAVLEATNYGTKNYHFVCSAGSLCSSVSVGVSETIDRRELVDKLNNVKS